jgi:hypothetical protein
MRVHCAKRHQTFTNHDYVIGDQVLEGEECFSMLKPFDFEHVILKKLSLELLQHIGPAKIRLHVAWSRKTMHE